MLNKFLGIGNLTKDPEIKKFENGKCVGAFTLAVNLNKNDKSPLFIDIQVWDRVAQNCQKYLKKGRKVFVEGKLNLNSWTSKTGEKKSKIFCKADVVTFLNSDSKTGPTDQNETKSANQGSDIDYTEEDEELANIPF